MSEEKDNAKTVQKPSKAAAGDKKDAPVMVWVEALKTPVKTQKANLAKGGRVKLDKPTAQMKADAGEVVILSVVSD